MHRDSYVPQAFQSDELLATIVWSVVQSSVSGLNYFFRVLRVKFMDTYSRPSQIVV
jgi:hypothetical protein